MPNQLSRLRNNSGSALIGVILITMALSIAAAGYFQLMGHSARHSIGVEEELFLRMDAESGVYIGRHYISLATTNEIIAVAGPNGNNINIVIIRDAGGEHDLTVTAGPAGGRHYQIACTIADNGDILTWEEHLQ